MRCLGIGRLLLFGIVALGGVETAWAMWFTRYHHRCPRRPRGFPPGINDSGQGKARMVRDHSLVVIAFKLPGLFIGDLSPFRLEAKPDVLLAGAMACAAR
jgi:hypothetical protein